MIIDRKYFLINYSMLKICVFMYFSFFSSRGFAQLETVKDSAFKLYTFDSSKIKNKKEEAKVSLKIYPNPAKNKITLDVTGFNVGLATVKIIDTKGKVWREDTRLLTNGNEEIIMFLMMPPGIYFISLSEKGKNCKRKLVVF